MQGEFMRWSDKTSPRMASIVENLFGESVQLHPDYLLQDESRFRPMIVKYRWTVNYIVEGIIVALFLMGIWMGRRNSVMWLCLSWFGLDMLLHVGVGFGLNEIYIMTAHWAFVLPVAMASLLVKPTRWRNLCRVLIGVLTLWLYIYNGYHIVKYMLC